MPFIAPAPPADPPGHYLPRAELAHLLTAYAEAQRPTDALGRAILAIAGGVWDKHQFALDRDDFVQSCALHLLQLVRRGKVDPTRNPFSYLTTCAERLGFRLLSRAAARARREHEFRTKVIALVTRHFGKPARANDDATDTTAAELPDVPPGDER